MLYNKRATFSKFLYINRKEIVYIVCLSVLFSLFSLSVFADTILYTKDGNDFSSVSGQYLTADHCYPDNCGWVVGDQIVLGVYNNWTGGSATWVFNVSQPLDRIRSATITIEWPASYGKGLHSVAKSGSATISVNGNTVASPKVSTSYRCPNDYFAHPCGTTKMNYSVPVSSIGSTTDVTVSVADKTFWDIGKVTLKIDLYDFEPQPEAKPPSTGSVKVVGRKLYVDGEEFEVKSVGYAPIPIGQNPEWGYDITVHPELWARDFPLLRAMGANTIRTWGKVNSTSFLDNAWNNGNQPIRVIMGYWMGSEQDYQNEAVRRRIIADFKAYVNKYKNHPPVLMWAIGNEENYFYAKGDNQKHKAYFSLVNEMAKAAYEIEGTSYHPVAALALEFPGRIDTVGSKAGGADDASLPYVDIWGINYYPGSTFGNFFNNYSKKTTKPLLITEYGIDALDNRTKKEYEQTQANWDVALWREISASNVAIGGSIMAYSDEWWKDWNGSVFLHDFGGYATESQPDGYANEEWWGIVKVEKSATGIDRVIPRKVYYALQQEFGGTQPQPKTNSVWKPLLFHEPFESISSARANGWSFTGSLWEANGKLHKALYFPGESGAVYSLNKLINSDEGTIEFWFNPEFYLRKGDLGVGLLEVGQLGQANSMALFIIPYFGKHIVIMEIRDASGKLRQSWTKKTIVRDGKWHHVALTWQCNQPNDYIRVFFDGRGGSIERGACRYLNISGPLRVAKVSGHYYKGPVKIDDLRIYNYIRSNSQIGNDYRHPIDVALPRLIAPENGAKIAQTQSFSWQANGFDKFRVEVSSDKGFDKKKTRTLTGWLRGTSTTLEKYWRHILNLEEKDNDKVLYWRVLGSRKYDLEYSNGNAFTLRQPISPTLQCPTQPIGKDYSFSWNAGKALIGYRNKSADGILYARIYAKDRYNRRIYSNVCAFRLK